MNQSLRHQRTVLREWFHVLILACCLLCRWPANAQMEGTRSKDWKAGSVPADSAEAEVVLLDTLAGHEGGHQSGVVALAISPDGKLLASGGGDSTVKLWSLPEGALFKTLADSLEPLAISPDGKLLASGGGDGTVKLWSLPEGMLLNTLAVSQGRVAALAISPDGKLLASGGESMAVKLWSLPEGRLLTSKLVVHSAGVAALAISPDGTLLASGGGDETVELWSLPEGALLKTLAGHQGGVAALAISPDGTLLASGSADHTVKLWSLPDGVLLKTLAGHQSGVAALAISRDGKLLASGDDTVKLWSLPEGALLKTLADSFEPLAISPDGKLLASGGENKTVKLWSLDGKSALTDGSAAGGFSWLNRYHFGSRLVNETRILRLDFISACTRVVFSWPSLAYSGGLAIALALPYWLRVRKRHQVRHGGNVSLPWFLASWGFVWVAVSFGLLRYGIDGDIAITLSCGGGFALVLALPYWRHQVRHCGNVWLPWFWVPWGFAWVAVMYGFVYGFGGIAITLSCGGALVVVVWRFKAQKGADFGSRLVVWSLWTCALTWLVNGLLRGGPFAVAAMLVMATFVAFPKWMGWWIRRPYWAVPGMGGWLVLGWVWVVLLLYGVILRWNWGSVVFLTIALIPAWLVVLVAIAMGLARWPKARQRAAGFVCRDDFHRFVPAPSLSWVQRWSGRWLWREHNAPKDMADSCVCPFCGKVGRFEGVLQIVAVLDNSAGAFDSRQHNSTLQVNWLQHRQPFDFDQVEIVHATDVEAEQFVRQTRYDSDASLQRRLPNMACVVNAQCLFQRANTLTILRQTFGSVTQE